MDRSQRQLLAKYIIENADKIPVRAKVDDKWSSFYLTELPPRQAIEEAFRLLLCDL